MTMRMGKSLVEEETSSAVETELGRGYVGSSPANASGEKGLDVRKRMERWKARVERVQRRTVGRQWMRVVFFFLRGGGALTEEEILKHNRLLCQPSKRTIPQQSRRVWATELLDARPGQVDLEEQKQNAETHDGGLQPIPT
jgi:hypothetical protein